MRVWRCAKYDHALGAVISWHASEREARAELRRFQRERDGEAAGPEGVDRVDIPTTKAALLVWLNSNVQSNNG